MSKSVEERIRSQQERLQKAEQRRARERRRLQRLQQEMNENERKRDTRRKILVGALVLEHADRMEERGDTTWQRLLDELLQSRLTRDDDRELFGLAPLPANGAKGEAETGEAAEASRSEAKLP